MTKRQIVLIVTITMLLVFLASCTINLSQKGVERTESLEIEQDLREQLQVGMTRNEVIKIVQDAYWRHYNCRHLMVDVYLVGSRNPDFAGIIYLKFTQDGQTEVLSQVYSYENYMLDDFDVCEVTEK